MRKRLSRELDIRMEIAALLYSRKYLAKTWLTTRDLSLAKVWSGRSQRAEGEVSELEEAFLLKYIIQLL
jgi:hypothetical protein